MTTKTTPKRRGRPPKRKAERKSDVIRVLVTADQRRLFEAAAALAHIEVSTWMRIVAEERATAMGVKR